MSFAEQMKYLQSFLDSEEVHEEALDYMAACGYLTAICICPENIPAEEWIQVLFSESPDYENAGQKEKVESALILLHARIGQILASDEEFELPCSPSLGSDSDNSDIRSWCIGFMEGVFLREEAWFADDEETASELLYPIMAGSGLFDEEPEFSDLAENTGAIEQMLQQVPEILTDLYLLYHAPADKS